MCVDSKVDRTTTSRAARVPNGTYKKNRMPKPYKTFGAGAGLKKKQGDWKISLAESKRKVSQPPIFFSILRVVSREPSP